MPLFLNLNKYKLMKFLLSIFILLITISTTAQTDFAAAAVSYENNENEKALSILSQIEAKVGANPKIESLRSLTYHQMGEIVNAYSSVLRYFELAKNNSNSSENSNMKSLKTELKISLENEFRQKQEQILKKRNQMSNTVVNSKDAKIRSASKEKQKAFDEFYDSKIKNTKTDFTADEINIIKENIKTKTAENLDAKTLKIAVLKFSDILYIGQDENVIVDAVYNMILSYLQLNESRRDEIKKKRKIKFKTESDYHNYLNGLKEDLTGFFKMKDINKRDEESTRIDNKFLISLYDTKLDCNPLDAVPFGDNKQGKVQAYYIYTQNGKLSTFVGNVKFSDDGLDFTKSNGLNLNNAPLIKNELEKVYGSVDEKIRKSESERNFAKYFNYEYQYTIKTNNFQYRLVYYFNPYGYENGNRDVIKGSVLRSIWFNVSHL